MTTTAEQKIKTLICEFIADLKDNVLTDPGEKNDAVMIHFFFSKMNPSDISQHVIQHVLPHSLQIRNRDEKFFMEESKNIFAGLPADRVHHFVRKISTVGEDDKNTIWEYFQSIVTLAERIKKKV